MDAPNDQTISNAVKLLGEAIVPGASLLLSGNIVSGSAHLIVGTWAKVAFGPVGAALVIANSYSESTTGKSILKHFSKLASDLQSSVATVTTPKGDEPAAKSDESTPKSGEA